jgi:diadenosine tetraphosphate (Ap4A) HIT family hydrolase
MLIIPNRHFENYFDATDEEKVALWTMVDEGKELIDKLHLPDGYNIGINIGQAAGQTILHLHIHIIPRYVGDVEDPRGGVRGVIPGKQKY